MPSIAGYRKEIYFRARLSDLRSTASSDTVGTTDTGAVTGTVNGTNTQITYTDSPYTARSQAQQAWTRWVRGQLPGSSGSLSLSGELLDDTNFFSQGWMSRVVGLRDWSITGSAFYQAEGSSSTNPTSIIRQAWARRQPVQIAYLPDGNNGFYGLCEIETLDLSGDVNGLETFDFTFQANGPLYSYFNEAVSSSANNAGWPDSLSNTHGATGFYNITRPSGATSSTTTSPGGTLREQIRDNSGQGNLPPFYDPDFDAPAN